MGTSTLTSAICVSLPLLLIGVCYLALPRNTFVLSCSLVGVVMAIVSICVRILFGRPMAKRIEEADFSIVQRD